MRGVRVSLDERPRRALGQYFTPQSVARLAVRLLAHFGAFEGGDLSVIDPSAGPGLFLTAVASAAPAARLIGLDIDAALTGDRVLPGNGLLDHPQHGVRAGAFDIAVGNPPYGGLGLDALLALSRGQASEAAWRLADEVLEGGELLPASLPGDALPDLRARRLSPLLCRWLDRAFRYPIENLFLERFVRLLKDGGWMAVVVPEGILANARTARLRTWMAARGQVAAVVGLPRVFSTAGASARTALLVYQRSPVAPRPVLFSDVGMEWVPRGERAASFDVEAYLEAPPTWEVPWDEVRDVRWDARFWDPRFARPLGGLGDWPLVTLGDVVAHLTYGPIVVGRDASDCAGDVPVISQGQIEESGVNLAAAPRVEAGGVFDPARCRVQHGDLLFPRSGAGSLGRNRLAVYDGHAPAALGCFVNLVRIRGLNPWYVWYFLKTRFGWGQIRRLINGVGMPNISFDELRSLRIPRLDAPRQDEVEARWRVEVAPAHARLVAACERGAADVAALRAAAGAASSALARRVEAWLAAP